MVVTTVGGPDLLQAPHGKEERNEDRGWSIRLGFRIQDQMRGVPGLSAIPSKLAIGYSGLAVGNAF